jgi:hypothetical protein
MPQKTLFERNPVTKGSLPGDGIEIKSYFHGPNPLYLPVIGRFSEYHRLIVHLDDCGLPKSHHPF